MRNLLLIVAALLALSSCRVTRERCNQLYPPVTYHTSDTLLQVRETIVHDTTYIQADNSELEVYFEAEADTVKLVKSESKAGRRSGIQYRTERNNNTLRAVFECHCDSLTIYHTFKDRDTSLTVSNKQVDIHQVNAPAQLTWWQQFKVDYGGYAIGLILLYLLLKLGWRALRTYTSIQFPGAGVISKFL